MPTVGSLPVFALKQFLTHTGSDRVTNDQRAQSVKRPKAISLFSGCGGSDAGVISAGFDVVMANDCLEYARDAYVANQPETDFKLCDVAEITKFPRADLLIGCYPCQGFSQGGARDSGRKINFLYREFDRALRKVKPKAFIVENVSGMQRADFGHLLRSQLTRFRLAGYKVKSQVLNAEDFGVAQERRRIFIVGVRSDLGAEFNFPEPTHGPTLAKNYVTIEDAIGDLPLWPEDDQYWQEPFHWYYLSRNRRRDWGEISKTIVSHPRHMPLHPVSPELRRIHTDKWVWSSKRPGRRFSFVEAARLQGFEEFEFPDTFGMRMKYRVVGNAVPPPLFSAVARALPDVW